MGAAAVSIPQGQEVCVGWDMACRQRALCQRLPLVQGMPWELDFFFPFFSFCCPLEQSRLSFRGAQCPGDPRPGGWGRGEAPFSGCS